MMRSGENTLFPLVHDYLKIYLPKQRNQCHIVVGCVTHKSTERSKPGIASRDRASFFRFKVFKEREDCICCQMFKGYLPQRYLLMFFDVVQQFLQCLPVRSDRIVTDIALFRWNI